MHLPIEGNGAVHLPMDGRQTWMASYNKIKHTVSEFFCHFPLLSTVLTSHCQRPGQQESIIVHLQLYNMSFTEQSIEDTLEDQMDSPHCLPLSLATEETHLLHDDKMRRYE